MSTEPPTLRRLVIHGCSGSGKSALARRLSLALRLPHIELDSLFHQPGWVPTPEAEFAEEVTRQLDLAEREQGGWIVDGNYDSTLHNLVRDRADTVIWFDLPRHVVMRRVVTRTLRRALFREVLWNGNRERWLNILRWDPKVSIIRWAWTRHGVYAKRLRVEAIDHGPQQRWIRLATQRDVDRVLSVFSC